MDRVGKDLEVGIIKRRGAAVSAGHGWLCRRKETIAEVICRPLIMADPRCTLRQFPLCAQIRFW